VQSMFDVRELVELGFVGHVVPLASCYDSTALVEL
jgi:hypothetical protein